jgi:predicted alpha/beta-fold hydrolase
MPEVPFCPHPWLRNPHAMTILPVLARRHAKELDRTSESVLVEVEPGSQVLIHSHVNNSSKAPILILMHGLEGSASSPYMLSLTEKGLAAGFDVVRMNLRNCGGTLHLTPNLYNGGMSNDALAVADFLTKQHPGRDIILIGYSLGGNIALKAAAECHNQRRIAGACAVSPSIDLQACVASMEKGFNRLYEANFLHRLKGKVRQKSKFFPGRFDLSLLARLGGMRAFDDLFTAPDGGYENGVDYYTKASSLHLLQNITVPTLIVIAQDDPIVPFEIFRTLELDSKYITLLAPAHGGHGGFINSRIETNMQSIGHDRRWAEHRILEFCLRHWRLDNQQ